MKILIVGAHNSGAIENFYVHSFRTLGWEVYTYDIQTPVFQSKNTSFLNKLLFKVNPNRFFKVVNEGIIDFSSRVSPEIILIFKGMELMPETVAELKENTKLLANYNADHPFKFYSSGSGNQNIASSLPLYDIHFSYSLKIVNQLKLNLKKDAYWLPFGYDNTIKIDKTDARYENHFLFIGSWDMERMNLLRKIKIENFQIFGNQDWKIKAFYSSAIKNMYQNKVLHDEEYYLAIKFALGQVNILRPQNILEDSHNMRTFEVPGYGGLLISQRTEEQENFFESDKEAVYYNDIEELNDKLLFLNRNTDVINSIKKAAFERSKKCNYSYLERTKEMSKIYLKYI